MVLWLEASPQRPRAESPPWSWDKQLLDPWNQIPWCDSDPCLDNAHRHKGGFLGCLCRDWRWIWWSLWVAYKSGVGDSTAADNSFSKEGNKQPKKVSLWLLLKVRCLFWQRWEPGSSGNHLFWEAQWNISSEHRLEAGAADWNAAATWPFLLGRSSWASALDFSPPGSHPTLPSFAKITIN